MTDETRDSQGLFDTGVRFGALVAEHPLPIVTPWGEFALFKIRSAERAAGEVFCVQSFCPHLGGPLFQGTISGESISCPWHLWRFSLRTGARLDGVGVALRRCEVHVGDAGELRLAPPTIVRG